MFQITAMTLTFDPWPWKVKFTFNVCAKFENNSSHAFEVITLTPFIQQAAQKLSR